MEDEMTLDGVLIWTDDAERDEYVQQDSDWTDNWQVRLTGVGSVVDVKRGGRSGMKSRLRRMLPSSRCLRGIGRLVGHTSRCFGCTRPRVYHCTTRVPAYAEEENVEVSSIESLFFSETNCCCFVSYLFSLDYPPWIQPMLQPLTQLGFNYRHRFRGLR